ncbi:FKBP-type peptidyl-prolyl cis-trans isomerase [Specibacter sp. RAF43]|uniref:FKBP-type peptidyl-prolyl cis-trans isomerase n=1 Tax=Specibacter sp. RAF43 TaxID=3233057 RepID=UPI003F97539E
MRRILALLLPLLLLVTACATGTPAAKESPAPTIAVPAANAEALASVKVADAGKNKAPTVSFTKPLAVSAESIRIVEAGTGAAIKAGQNVDIRAVALDATTGKTLGESFSSGAAEAITLSDAMHKQFPLVYSTFVTANVGSYIAYGTPASLAVAATAASAAQAAQPAQVTVFQVMGAKDPAKLMSADEVKKLAQAGGLPAATFDAKGVPAVTIPKKAAPADLAVQVLTEGKGAPVAATDSISASYTGWRWADGKKFDSSFDSGAPITFSLQGVIPGWTMGLAGQKVGSTVLLTIPGSLAYGDVAQAGKPAGTLVFVVKIDAKK